MRERHDELIRRAVGPKGRFRLFRPAAATRFGSLWHGEDTMGGRPVLVEVVRQPLPSTPEDRKRLRNRMAEAQDLPPHPAILAIRSIHAPDPPGPLAVGARLRSRRGVDEDEWLLVLEPFDGTTLERRAAFGGLSSADVYAIGARVGEALQSLHAVDVAHGSISATSILVDDDGDVRLFDALVGTWWGGSTHAGPSERRGDVVALARVVVDLVDDDHIAEVVRRAVDGEDVPLEELVTSLRAAGTAASFVRDARGSERAGSKRPESEGTESEGTESPVERGASTATEVEPSASEPPAAPDRPPVTERTAASDRPAATQRRITADRPAASEPPRPRRPRRASLGAELRALEETLEAERRRLADLEARANELRVSAEPRRRTEPRRRPERDRDGERPLRIVLPEAEGDGDGDGERLAHHPNGAPRRRHPSDGAGSDRPRGSGVAPTENPFAAPTTQVDRIVEIPEPAARVAEPEAEVAEPEAAEPEVAEPEISPEEERERAEARQRILERSQLFERRPSPEYQPTPDAIREHAIDVAPAEPKEDRRRADRDERRREDRDDRRRTRKQEREEARRDKRAHKQAVERMREVEHKREAATAERPAATPKRARKPEKPEKLRPSRNAQAYGVADLEPALWMKVVAAVASLLMFAGLAVGAYFLFFAGP